MKLAAALHALMFVVFFCGPFVSATDAHDFQDLHRRYDKLSPKLAEELRANDHERTPDRIRGYEAAQQNVSQRDAILEQFGLADGNFKFKFEQIYIAGTLWPITHRFRICFFDGPIEDRSHVLDVFGEIIKETHLKIDRTDRQCPDKKADIQIRFNERPCGSVYGKDSLKVIIDNPQNSTLALCKLTGPFWPESSDGIIRHEFMHALGAVHEHQHPDSKCADELDIDYFRKNLIFDPDKDQNEKAIDDNWREITRQYPRSALEIIDYDPKSIMHYRGRPEYFKDPKRASCLLNIDNDVLSPADARFLQTMYNR